MRKRWFVAAAVATLALLLVSADTVSAQRFGRFGGRGGWGGGYYGGWGGYGSGYYGGLGNGWGLTNYGWGGAYNPYTGYRLNYGLYPNNYYSSGFVPSYGYTGTYYMPGYASSGVLPGGTTSMYYQPGTQPGAATTDPNAAVIDLQVPADAQVWFDGDATNQRGTNRLFTSPPLGPGKAYHYDVKARWTENGRPVERTRRVDVRAGQHTTVDFTRDQGADRDRDLNRDQDLNRDRNRSVNPDRPPGTAPVPAGTNPGRTSGSSTNPNRTGSGAPNPGPGR
jgi:uncharacterized protein (TIGR03000 family)